METTITAKIEINQDLLDELRHYVQDHKAGAMKEDRKYYQQILDKLEEEDFDDKDVNAELECLILLHNAGFTSLDYGVYSGWEQQR